MGESSGLMNRIIYLKEHGRLSKKYSQYVYDIGINLHEKRFGEKLKFLGITHDMRASYYIGADWLDEKNNLAVVVLPKKDMEKVDYFKMFMSCLENNLSPDYFSSIYGIDYERKFISCAHFQDQITPLLVMHYLTVLKGLVKRGLKRDYVLQEDNLHCKIRGRILVSENLHANVIPHRLDRCCCSYQEYTVDNNENRLLKKALLFSSQFIRKFSSHELYPRLLSLTNTLLSHFENIGSDIEIYQIGQVTSNKLFKDYNKAIYLAKQILRLFGYSIEKIHNQRLETPVFWIDMSRLYEVYVYGLLHKAYKSEILFQVLGYNGCAVDFIKLDEKLIIDTKYKPKYEDGNEGIISDIRQISGYARDEKIINHIEKEKKNNEIYPCLIIYPEKVKENGIEVFEFDKKEKLLQKAQPIEEFRNFYKLAVQLPFKP
jgi:McrBC 5-methylcytosine restriction system component